VIIRSGLSGLGVTLLRSVSVNLAELRRVLMCEGLNVALLRSVSVNLAELRRVQPRHRGCGTRSRALSRGCR